MKITEKHLFVNGKKVLVSLSSHTQKKTKCIFVFIHDLGENSNKYVQWFQLFEEIGVATISFDMPGHGSSEGKKDCFETTKEVFEIIDKMLVMAEVGFNLVPVVLYGNGLGAAIAVEYYLTVRPKVIGLILASPLLELKQLQPKKQGFFTNLFQKNSIKVETKTDNNQVDKSLTVTRYKEELLQNKDIANSFSTISKMIEHVLSTANRIMIPTLLLYGEKAQKTEIDLTGQLLKNIGKKATLVALPNMFYELHDSQPNRVSMEIIRWIKEFILNANELQMANNY